MRRSDVVSLWCMSDRDSTPGADSDITPPRGGDITRAVHLTPFECRALRLAIIFGAPTPKPPEIVSALAKIGVVEGSGVRMPGPDVSRIRSSAQSKRDIKPVPKAPGKGGK